jgi:hypothetical protein
MQSKNQANIQEVPLDNSCLLHDYTDKFTLNFGILKLLSTKIKYLAVFVKTKNVGHAN